MLTLFCRYLWYLIANKPILMVDDCGLTEPYIYGTIDWPEIKELKLIGDASVSELQFLAIIPVKPDYFDARLNRFQRWLSRLNGQAYQAPYTIAGTFSDQPLNTIFSFIRQHYPDQAVKLQTASVEVVKDAVRAGQTATNRLNGRFSAPFSAKGLRLQHNLPILLVSMVLAIPAAVAVGQSTQDDWLFVPVTYSLTAMILTLGCDRLYDKINR